jgi:hypothetical protein
MPVWPTAGTERCDLEPRADHRGLVTPTAAGGPLAHLVDDEDPLARLLIEGRASQTT